jgi:hypothetical protein
MLWVLSRYNHDVSYLPRYTEDYVMYDRSEKPIDDPRVIRVANIGTDWYDKFTYIIDNYNDLPDVALYTKANIFKYITPEELDEIKDNTTFTPILTKHHKTIPGISYYGEDGMYYEINNLWYLGAHPVREPENALDLMLMLGISGKDYVPFAPGSGYIVPKENILKHPRSMYVTLRSYLEWAVYPGEAQIVERGIYTFWK